jgi:hypothetical protein
MAAVAQASPQLRQTTPWRGRQNSPKAGSKGPAGGDSALVLPNSTCLRVNITCLAHRDGAMHDTPVLYTLALMRVKKPGNSSDAMLVGRRDRLLGRVRAGCCNDKDRMAELFCLGQIELCSLS